MHRIVEFMKKGLPMLAAMVGLAFVMPSYGQDIGEPVTNIWVELNDIPGDYKLSTNIVEYVDYKTKAVVTNAVSWDELETTLTNYAPVVKVVSVSTNGSDIVTNYTAVAYLDDIPPDIKKADKIRPIWDYWCSLGVLLTRSLDTNAPFASWHWAGDAVSGIHSIDLSYTNGVWECLCNAIPPPLSTNTTWDATTLTFPNSLTFTATNSAVSFVVYTDMLTEATNIFERETLSAYVAKTNLQGIVYAISDTNLVTVNGIADTLRNIRSAVKEIIGAKGITLTFDSSSGSSVDLGTVEMVIPGDTVDIDWGNGEKSIRVSLANGLTHTYSGTIPNPLVVTILGDIRCIGPASSTSEGGVVAWAWMGDWDNGLNKISIGETVGLSAIGKGAFSQTALASLSFLPSTINTLYPYCFFGMLNLTSLYGLPSGIKDIPSGCFWGSSIESLAYLPPGVTNLGSSAFHTTKLMSLLGMGNAVNTIGNRCFEKSSLETLNGISSGIREIGSQAFAKCRSLSDASALGTSILNSLGDMAFEGCTNLTSIVLPNSLQSIGFGAFSHCTRLGEIAIPGNVATNNIGEGAFVDIGADLDDSQMVLPGGTNVFYKAAITFSQKNLDSINVPLLEFWLVPTNTVIFCEDGYCIYVNGAWTKFDTTVSLTLRNVPGITTILLTGIPSGTVVEWGDGTSSDSNYSHSYRRPITAETPRAKKKEVARAASEYDYVIKIRTKGHTSSISGTGSAPFIQVSGATENRFLTDVSIGSGSGITAIGVNCFSNCIALKTVTALPNTLTSIDSFAFAGCTNLSDISFLRSSSINAISSGCFSGCTAIEEVPMIPSSVTAVGARAFKGCSALTSISGLSGAVNMVSIGEEAFANCPSLMSMSGIPETVSSVGARCFQNATALTSIGEWPNASAIPDGCFQNCRGLTSLENFPSNVVSIGSDAFRGAQYVSDASFRGQVNSIGANAFKNTGLSCSDREDDEFNVYKILYAFSNMTCVAVQNVIGGANLINASKIICKDGELIWDPNLGKFVAYVYAMEIHLSGVQSNSTFSVARFGVDSGESFLWNWGDGTRAGVRKGITDNPDPYTYVNGGDYTITVKGRINTLGLGTSLSSYPFLKTQWQEVSEVAITNLVTSNVVVVVDGVTNTAPMTYEVVSVNVLTNTISGNTNLTSVVLFSNSEASPDEYAGIEAIGDYAFASCCNLQTLQGFASPTRRGGTAKMSRRVSRRGGDASAVHTIGKHCFDGCTSLKNLAGLPAVSALPEYCFANCTGLETLDGMPPSVTTVGMGCFTGCSVLKDISAFPRSATGIPTDCFSFCYGITNLTGISTNAQVLEVHSFYGCTNLTTLEGMPSSINYIGTGSFQKVAIKDLTGLSTNVSTIQRDVFRDCDKLISLTGMSSNRVYTIEDWAFLECDALANANALAKSLTSLGSYSLGYTPLLGSGYISGSVTKIGEETFNGVGSEASNTVDEVGISASSRFDARDITCVRMIELLNANTNTNPNLEFICYDGYVAQVEGIWRAFYKTLKLELANVSGGMRFFLAPLTPAYSNMPVMVDWGDGSTPIPYTEGMSKQYLRTGDYTVTINGLVSSIDTSVNAYPMLYQSKGVNTNLVGVQVGWATDISRLGDYCFKGCKNLRSLQGFSECRVTDFGRECFAECKALGSLEGLPPSVSNLGEGCFSNCTSLLSLDGLPPSMAVLPTNCFFGCTSLAQITNFPISVSTVQRGAFRNCSALASLEGFSQMENISLEEYAFAGCSALKSLEGFSTNIVSLPGYLFADCTGLLSITGFPATVSYIPEGCFSGCYSLPSLAGCPDAVKSVEACAFRGCLALDSLSGISPNVSYIGDAAFMGCSLSDLSDIPPSTTTIGGYAFATNRLLKSIAALSGISNSLYLGVGTFEGCSVLGFGPGYLYIPSNAVAIGASAFKGCDMSWCFSVPTNCSVLSAELFAETSLTNLVLDHTPAQITMEDGIFTNETVSASWLMDGLTTTRVVWMNGFTVSDLTSSFYFPFGASATTRFICKDGFVVKHEDEWVAIKDKVMTISVADAGIGNAQLIFGKTFSPHGVWVDWGDGTLTPWATRSTKHTYTSDSYNTISVWGFFNRLGTFGNAPCLYLPSGVQATNVVFSPDCGLTELGNVCFAGIPLKEFPTLPTTITNIGVNCFRGCPFTNAVVYLPNLKVLPVGMFSNCTQLASVSIGEMDSANIQGKNRFAITNYAFNGCSSLRTINLPAQARYWAKAQLAFAGIGDPSTAVTDSFGYNITTTINLPCGAEDILKMSGFPWGAPHRDVSPYSTTKFCGTDGDIVYDVPQGKWVIERGTCFHLCEFPPNSTFKIENITSTGIVVVVWGDGVSTTNTRTGWDSHTYTKSNFDEAFIRIQGTFRDFGGALGKPVIHRVNEIDNPYLIEAVIANSSGCTNIGDYAFAGCTNLFYLSLPDTYQGIGDYAFSNCLNLTSIEWPASLYSIRDTSFFGCSNLIGITAAAWPSNIADNALSVIATNCFIQAANIWGEDHTNLMSEANWYGMPTNASITCKDGDIYYDWRGWWFHSKVIKIIINNMTGAGAKRFYMNEPMLKMQADALSSNAVFQKTIKLPYSARTTAANAYNLMRMKQWQSERGYQVSRGVEFVSNNYNPIYERYPERSHKQTYVHFHYSRIPYTGEKHMSPIGYVFAEGGEVLHYDQSIGWYTIDRSEERTTRTIVDEWGQRKIGDWLASQTIRDPDGYEFTIPYGTPYEFKDREMLYYMSTEYRKQQRGGDIQTTPTAQSFWQYLEPNRYAGFTGNFSDYLLPIEIYWGDGSSNFATFDQHVGWSGGYHVYSPSVTNATIRIIGYVQAISGQNGIPWVSVTDTNATMDIIFGELTTTEIVDNNSLDGTTWTVKNNMGEGKVPVYGPEPYSCRGLVSISLPQTVTKIGTYAFANNGLTSLGFWPKGIASVPEGCFSGSKIETLDGLTYNVTNLNAFAFRYCPLPNLEGMPQSVRNIGSRSSIPVPNTYSQYDGMWHNVLNDWVGAFCDNTNIFSLVGISTNVTEIPHFSFTGSNSLPSYVEIPSNITSLGRRTFEGCVALGFLTCATNSLPTFISDSSPWFSAPFDLKRTYLSDGIALADRPESVSPFITITLKNVAAGTSFGIGDMTTHYPKEPIRIDWGDESTNAVAVYHGAVISNVAPHTYASAGTYTLRIMGLVSGIDGAVGDGGSRTSFIYKPNGGAVPELTDFTITDCVGLYSRSATSFDNCPNASVSYLPTRMFYEDDFRTRAMDNHGIPFFYQGLTDDQYVYSKMEETKDITYQYSVPENSPRWAGYVGHNNWVIFSSKGISPVFKVSHKRKLSTIMTMAAMMSGSRKRTGGSVTVATGTYKNTNPYIEQIILQDPWRTEIADGEFSKYTRLSKVTWRIPEDFCSLSYIGTNAFANTAVSTFGTIPTNVTEIGARAFASTAHSKKIVFPHTGVIKRIGPPDERGFPTTIYIYPVTIGANAFGIVYAGEKNKVTEISFNGMLCDEVRAMPNFPFMSIKLASGADIKQNSTKNVNISFKCQNGSILAYNAGTTARPRWEWSIRVP